MKPIFILNTNEGQRYVRSTHKELRTKMFAYIKVKRAKGLKLHEVMFCWSPIQTSGISTGE